MEAAHGYRVKPALAGAYLSGFTQATPNEAVKEVERITAEVTNLNLIDIQALTAIVRHGSLTALQIGPCDVGASVGIEGTTVVRRQAQPQLPVSIPLGTGMPLATPPHMSGASAEPGAQDP